MGTIEFDLQYNPNVENQRVLRDGIVNFNDSIINDKPKCFNIYAKQDKKTVGGAIVYQHSDAMYIDVIWLEESCRNQGIGTKIIKMIEVEAQKYSISKLFVDTYSFQAQDFYKKQGFHSIGTIPGYLLGHDRIFLKKNI